MSPTRRRNFPDSVKRARYEHCKDVSGVARCEDCTAALRPGHFRFDHDKPDYLGGEPTFANCRVRCDNCDSEKLSKIDRPAIDKSKRVQAFNLRGRKTKTKPLPGGRSDRFKIRMDGTVVYRASGKPVRMGR